MLTRDQAYRIPSNPIEDFVVNYQRLRRHARGKCIYRRRVQSRRRTDAQSWNQSAVKCFFFSRLFSPTPIIPSTCRSAPEGERTTAEDPAGRLAGRAHPRCDSRGGIPRRALTPHRQGGADHDVPQPGELRLQRSGRCGQPGRGGRSRGRSGRSR